MDVSDLSSSLLFPIFPMPHHSLDYSLRLTSTLFQTLPSARWTCSAQSLSSSAFLGDSPPTTDILGLGEWMPLQTSPVHWRLQVYLILFSYPCSAMEILDSVFLNLVPPL